VLRRVYCQALDQDSAEQMRRREVSRILEKMDLSPKEEESVERLSYSIVAKILTGPISEAMARMIHTVSTGRGVNHVLATSGAHVKDRSLEGARFLEEVYLREGKLDESTLPKRYRSL
jgi:hypothetical protein